MADGADRQNGPSGLPPSHPIGSPPATGRERMDRTSAIADEDCASVLGHRDYGGGAAGFGSGPTGVASGSVQVHGPTLQAIPGHEHPAISPRGVSLQTRHPSLTERIGPASPKEERSLPPALHPQTPGMAESHTRKQKTARHGHRCSRQSFYCSFWALASST